jgi:hypothetical protein
LFYKCGVLSAMLATVTSKLIVTRPRCAGLLLPSLLVHAAHKEPQAQRYFRDRCSREIREDPLLKRRRQKERETIDDVACALDRQQHAYESWKEGRPNNQVGHREAIESEEHQGNGEPAFKQLNRPIRCRL